MSPPNPLINSDVLKVALQLAPNHPQLRSVIQELLQGDLTQEIPDDKCANFNVTLDGPKYTCGLFKKGGQRCTKSFCRPDRFKHHLQTHLGLTPYKCMDSTKVTAEPKWYVLIPYPYILSFNHNPVIACFQASRRERPILTTRYRLCVIGK